MQIQVHKGPGHAGAVVDVVVKVDELHPGVAGAHGLDGRGVLGTGAVDDGDRVGVELPERAQQFVHQLGRVVRDGNQWDSLDVHALISRT
jgi:hypothetical protein